MAKLRAAGAEYTIDAAIYMNDISSIRARLAKDASWVNKRRGAQSVPLRVAARTGRVEICELLLEHKADPDDFELGMGFPILVDAVRHSAVVRLLIEHKANLKRRITWHGGRTGIWLIGDEASALHYAVDAGNPESVRLLIVAGIDPNAADEEGQTPLHIAVRCASFRQQGNGGDSEYVKVIALLLDNDASLRFHDRSGKTALELAKGSSKEIRQLLQTKEAEIGSRFRRALFEGR